MNGFPIDIVTVSHELRSGGSEIARRIGERLGWPVLDGATIVERAAHRLGVDPALIAPLDEHPASLLERLGAGLRFGAPEAPLDLTPDVPTADDVAAVVAAEVAQAAATPPLVILGHGAQCVLRGWRGALHVHVVAPLADRVARECLASRMPPAAAVAQLQRQDYDQAGYLRRYHKADRRDPLLYDLQVNTARLPVEEAAELIVRVVERRRAEQGGTLIVRHDQRRDDAV